MPFVRRDASGKVIAAYSDATGQAGEEVSAYDPELDRFLGRNDVLDPEWHKSDAELARVIEDLVAVLLDKGVIEFADLPEAARGKFLEREDFFWEVGSIVWPSKQYLERDLVHSNGFPSVP